MGEIKTNDLQEVKKPEMEGFTAIKPQEGTTVNDARDFCNDLFKSEFFILSFPWNICYESVFCLDFIDLVSNNLCKFVFLLV